jgi:hypothetical protein
MPDNEHRAEYDVPGERADPERLRDWLKIWNRKPVDLKFRTLFLDEAHALPAKGSDVLLKAVEEPAEGVVFVFATTEIDAMRPALLSRLAQLEVTPLTPMQSISFLRHFADAEGMKVDMDALALLAGLKNGYPRDLLIGLEQVCDQRSGRITRARVKNVFDIDHTDALIDYFCSLAEGDHAKQTEVFLNWREPAESKLRWVQSFLLSIYYCHVHGRPIVIDPLIEAIEPRAIGGMLERFRDRFGARTNRDLRDIFRAMVDFWATPVTLREETAILLRISAFHNLVNSERLTTSFPEVSRNSPGRNSGEPAKASYACPHVRTQLVLGPPQFMTTSDVGKIIRCASFLPQQHGLLFNVRFDLRPPLFGVVDELAAYNLIFDFCDDLALGRYPAAQEGEAFYLAQVERDHAGLRATVLANVGAGWNSGYTRRRRFDTLEALDELRKTWRIDERRHDDALGFQKMRTVKRDAVADHWKHTLDLCAGLADSQRTDGLNEPLLSLLGVRKRREAKAVRGWVLFTSDNLSEAAIEAAATNRMGFLSAFEHHAWDRLKDGWELDEFQARKDELKRREQDIARIESQCDDGTPEALARIEELRSSWPEDPRDRQRSWTGWWRQGPV